MLKLWVAAFGTYLLGRALGMRFGGALLAGIVFALNLKMVTWLSYPPWACGPACRGCCCSRSASSGGPSLLAAAGLAAVVGAAVPVRARRVELPRAPADRGLLRAAPVAGAARGTSAVGPAASAGFAGAVAGGAALAAVSLIPFAELLGCRPTSATARGESVDVSLPFQDASASSCPTTGAARPRRRCGRSCSSARCTSGALPLMLAAIALIVRPERERVAIAAFGFLWFAVAVGIPPFLQVVTRLPVFSSGHNTRLIVLTMLCLRPAGRLGAGRRSTAPGAVGARAAARRCGRCGACCSSRPLSSWSPPAQRAPGACAVASRSPGCSRDPPGGFRDAVGDGRHPAVRR